MEESYQKRSEYEIVFDQGFYKVRHTTVYVGGLFTSIAKARKYIEERVIAMNKETERKEYNSMIKELHKEPDIGKRTRKYKQLCQAKQK